MCYVFILSTASSWPGLSPDRYGKMPSEYHQALVCVHFYLATTVGSSSLDEVELVISIGLSWVHILLF